MRNIPAISGVEGKRVALMNSDPTDITNALNFGKWIVSTDDINVVNNFVCEVRIKLNFLKRNGRNDSNLHCWRRKCDTIAKMIGKQYF